MEKNTTKKILAVCGSAMLLAPSISAVPAILDGSQAFATTGQSVQGNISTAEEAVPVQGSFTFNQEVTSNTESISEVFCKAAASLCNTLPSYSAATAHKALVIAARNAEISATIEELKGSSKESSYVMACSCATNVAGGGAIANADVSGISLEAIASSINTL